MRKLVLSLSLLAGVMATASLVFAAVESEPRDYEGHDRRHREPIYHSGGASLLTRATNMRTQWGYGDTLYIGYTPGNKTASNPWSIRAATTGPATANVHRPPAAGCMWTFEPAAGETDAYLQADSLQGWWPTQMNYRFLFGTDFDWQLPVMSEDTGNHCNYRPIHGRTFGVVGVWHKDSGNGAAGVANGVGWAPLAGSYSAWCGLRRHGDRQYVDNITGNAFDAGTAIFNRESRYTVGEKFKKFPGYCDHWDQMLYRDFVVPGGKQGDDVTVTFTYRTAMSTTAEFVGWFDKDPLTITSDGSVNCAEGNFMEGVGDAAILRDSFMVYIGVPTEGDAQYFNGTCDPSQFSTRVAIYDTLRRWFDEVVEANDATLYKELLSVRGANNTTTSTAITITAGTLAPMYTASGGKLRLVFRVKTNEAGSDESGNTYTSGGVGAAIVDNVAYTFSSGGGSLANFGTFENGDDAIDNTQSALTAWKSTGKPPAIFGHIAELKGHNGGASYDDLCGSTPTTIGRICSMVGGVLHFGLHDEGDFLGDPEPYTYRHDESMVFMSPTVQLRSNNGSYPNSIGITSAAQAIGTNDVKVDYEVFAKTANIDQGSPSYGGLYRWIMQCWPQTRAIGPSVGVKHWGDMVRGFGNYQTDAICFRGVIGITGQEGNGKALGLMKYDATVAENADTPDSIRIGLLYETYYWLPGVAPPTLFTGGFYFDNVSLSVVDGPTVAANTEIWNWWQDAFPWNVDVTPAYSASFDTAGALIKGGTNNAAGQGATRFCIPGDTIVVTTSGNNPAPLRIDMVFRILPGPGNYVTVGLPSSGLSKNPQGSIPGGRVRAVPSTHSANFWESYMGDNGPYGTGGNGSTGGPGHPAGSGGGAGWDPNRWNSASCDSNEANLFPGPLTVPAVSTVTWKATLHERDYLAGGLRDGLGLSRHMCFDDIITESIDCVNDAGTTDGSTFDLSWVTTGAGYDAAVYGTGFTKEGTKIIPDGLLTPGTHVEYFYRKNVSGHTGLALQTGDGVMPDTNFVVPQEGERNNDGHRWQEFSILPDRWKSADYTHPLLGLDAGRAPACMLVVDDQDSNQGGDELAWVSVADTIGATKAEKYGAHNGWHAVGGGLDPNNPSNNRDPNGVIGFTSRHGGSPGTSWDFYQIKAAESTDPSGSFGSRYSYYDGSNAQYTNRQCQGAPTLAQINFFYKMILWLTGILNTGHMGPLGDRTADDVLLLDQWISGSTGSTLDKVFWAMGDGFIEAFKADAAVSHKAFSLNRLGVDAVASKGAYRNVAGASLASTVDLTIDPSNPIFDGTVFGVRNICNQSNDVLVKAGSGPTVGQTSYYAYYEDPSGPGTTFPASVYKAYNASTKWSSLVDGWAVIDFRSRFGTSMTGREKYYRDILTELYNGICNPTGNPVIPLDVPTLADGKVFMDFVSMRSSNPLVSGSAKIHFGLAKDDRVEIKVFDVTGRLIRTLADRQFKAGEYDLVWDGSDNSGRQVERGVYFTQVRYLTRGVVSANKLTILR